MAGITIPANARVRHENNFTNTAAYTICGWFRPSQTVGAINQRFFLSDFQILAEMDVGNVLQVRETGTGAWTAGSLTLGTYVSGTLFHLAITVVNSIGGAVSIYENGVLTASTTVTTASTASDGMHLGETSSMTTGSHFDFRYYDRALTANEVLTMYICGGRDGVFHGCLMRWTGFEAPVGTVITTSMLKNPFNPSSDCAVVLSPTIADSTGGAPNGYRRRRSN